MRRSLFWLLDQYPETGESVASVHHDALEQAAEADRLGFASLWLAEHHFRTLGTAPNPAILLAAMAQRTESIRLGPAVSVLPLRNPIHVAEDYALVDSLSGGRLNMGVGCGSQADEYTPFGVSFEERRAAFEANLAVLRDRWQTAAQGQTGTESINVAPVQSPPPIFIATLNEESAYKIGLAGDSLLTLVPPPVPNLDGAAACVRAHQRGLKESGAKEGAAESVVMVFAHVAETEAQAKTTAAPALARTLVAMGAAEPPDGEALYEQMRQNNVGLFGTPAQVSQQIEGFAELGMNHLAFVSRFGGMPKDAAAWSLRALAPGVTQ